MVNRESRFCLLLKGQWRYSSDGWLTSNCWSSCDFLMWRWPPATRQVVIWTRDRLISWSSTWRGRVPSTRVIQVGETCPNSNHTNINCQNVSRQIPTFDTIWCNGEEREGEREDGVAEFGDKLFGSKLAIWRSKRYQPGASGYKRSVCTCKIERDTYTCIHIPQPGIYWLRQSQQSTGRCWIEVSSCLYKHQPRQIMEISSSCWSISKMPKCCITAITNKNPGCDSTLPYWREGGWRCTWTGAVLYARRKISKDGWTYINKKRGTTSAYQIKKKLTQK